MDNKFFVGARGDKVVVMMPIHQGLSKDEALNLAGHLVVLSGATKAEIADVISNIESGG